MKMTATTTMTTVATTTDGYTGIIGGGSYINVVGNRNVDVKNIRKK